MATRMLCTIDLLSLPEAKKEFLPNNMGEMVEYVCIPIKEAGLRASGRSVSLPFVVEPRREPIWTRTHFISPRWSGKYLENRVKQGLLTPFIGSGTIKFVYKEPIKPKPISLNDIDFNGEEY